MKAKIAVVALCAVTACGAPGGHRPKTLAPTPAASTIPPSHPNPASSESLDAKALDLITHLARDEFEAAAGDFGDTMLAALPADRLGEVWHALEASLGPFAGVERVRPAPSGDGRTWMVRCRFERGVKAARITFNDGGHVVGLFFVDVLGAFPWSPPPYADTSSFAERPVSVGRNPELPGVIALPHASGRAPAAVLVHGSGPHDADETIGQVKVFKDIAYGLASRGIAVLRYTKRTLVDPRGVVTVKEEVIDDAVAAVESMAQMAAVDPDRIVVIGHSLGGYLAPRIARDEPRVAAIVVLAGNTRPIEEVTVDQVRYLTSIGVTGPRGGAAQEVAQFKAAVDDPSLTPDRELPPLAGGARGAYFLDLRGYHPEQIAAAWGGPMVIAHGDRDYQVGAADFAGWRSALGASPQVTWKEYPALDHLFVAGSGPSRPSDYDRPGHVDAAVIEDVAAWIAALRPRVARGAGR
jgi:dienelactone hydrolase